jgi:radical SAM-linked protein
VARTPDGPPPPPAVQRLRLRYAKRGRLRFSSHRDFQRSLERALRRAGVPMAYSAGFTPHPKVSYANAAPTGAASEAEYLEISLARHCDPDLLRRALDEALPDGLDLVAAVEAGPGALADRLQASLWRVELPGVAAADLRTAVDAFLAAERVEVQRMTKSGLRTFDARGAVVRTEVTEGRSGGPADPRAHDDDRPGSVVGPQSSEEGPCAILQVVVRHATPAVRPDDVLAALRAVADLAPPSPPVVTRLAQGPLDEADGSVADPLAADRDVAGG